MKSYEEMTLDEQREEYAVLSKTREDTNAALRRLVPPMDAKEIVSRTDVKIGKMSAAEIDRIRNMSDEELKALVGK